MKTLAKPRRRWKPPARAGREPGAGPGHGPETAGEQAPTGKFRDLSRVTVLDVLLGVYGIGIELRRKRRRKKTA
ncbi:MAG: hypothetical protein ACRDKS_03810 [Actinomycetota bacterium]